MNRSEALPFDTQVMLKNVEFDAYDQPILDNNETDNLDEVKAITSIVQGTMYDFDGFAMDHKMVIDVDFPVFAVPSSTPGHSHLYIDKVITREALNVVLQAMADAGIVERGYADACEDQGMSVVRAPWEKK